MPPNQANPYDFITSAPAKPPRKLLPTNRKGIILLIIAASVVFIVIIVVVNSFLGKASQAQNQKLIELTQTQTEIVRVASIGASGSRSLETKSLAINTQLSVESAKQDVRQALKKRKVKAGDKVLNKAKNTKTDALLKDATANNRFDQTFTEIIQTQLASYQEQAQSVYASSTSIEQKTFQKSFSGTDLLLAPPKQTN